MKKQLNEGRVYSGSQFRRSSGALVGRVTVEGDWVGHIAPSGGIREVITVLTQLLPHTFLLSLGPQPMGAAAHFRVGLPSSLWKQTHRHIQKCVS